MPAPDTLQDLANQEISELTTALAAVRVSQDAAAANLKTQQGARSDVANHLAEEGDKLAEDRAKLALIAMPGDGDPLLADLETRIGNLRRYSAQAFDAERIGSDAQIDLDLSSARLATLQGALDDANALLDDSRARRELRARGQAF